MLVLFSAAYALPLATSAIDRDGHLVDFLLAAPSCLDARALERLA
jgi:hypothetical protein